MTISMAWERRIGGQRELVFACDSMLTGGETWGGCPKLFTFEREDCVLAFAGDTYYAYPAAVQVAEALRSYRPFRERSKDISVVSSHIVAVMNDMLVRRKEADPPSTAFIFGGWSWKYSRFQAWIISRTTHNQFQLHRARSRQAGCMVFVGDPPEAESDVRKYLINKRVISSQDGNRELNWEPLQVLCDMIRSGKHRSVGGPPQVAKVYSYARTQIFAVYWRNGHDEDLTIRGRYALSYELPDNTVLDPDTGDFFNARGRIHLHKVLGRLLRLLYARHTQLASIGSPPP